MPCGFRIQPAQRLLLDVPAEEPRDEILGEGCWAALVGKLWQERQEKSEALSLRWPCNNRHPAGLTPLAFAGPVITQLQAGTDKLTVASTIVAPDGRS